MIAPTAGSPIRSRGLESGADDGPRGSRAVAILLVASLVPGVLVWLVRVAGAVRLDRPCLAATSGGEEEMLFSVWKGIHGLPIYNDPWLPPFTDSPYGWLFFRGYTVWSAGWLAALGLDDAWLPTVSRCFTLVGMAVAMAALAGLLRDTARGGMRRLAWPLALLALANPLFHWWSFTTRPDTWALAMELVALRAAVRAVRSGGFWPLLFAAVPAYMAWAVRQSNVSVLAGLGCALVLDGVLSREGLTQPASGASRDDAPAAPFGRWGHLAARVAAGPWGRLAALVAVMAAAFAATFAALGRNFWESAIVAMAVAGDMRLDRVAAVAVSGVTRNPLLAVSAAALPVLLVVRRSWRRDPVARLLVCTAAFALLFNLALAARTGSDTNYLMPAAAFLPPAVLAVCGGGRRGLAWGGLFVATGSVGLLVAGAIVLLGVRGRLAVEDDTHVHRLRALGDRLARPVFCTHVAANVPWVLGDGAGSMVVGFPYAGMLRSRPERFAGGTVERMLRDGTFATIVFADRHGWWREADADLTGYVRGPACPGYTIWEKTRPE